MQENKNNCFYGPRCIQTFIRKLNNLRYVVGIDSKKCDKTNVIGRLFSLQNN